MGLIKRNRQGESESVELVAAGNGVVVQGSPGAVTAFVDRMVALTESQRIRRVVVDGLAVAGHVAAFARTHREYFEFAPDALAKLREHGAIPTGDGWFRSFVRSGPAANSPFAGNLNWRSVSFAPEQALAMQTAVATLALRAAIKDVAAAVERVEGKVDKLVALARAERLGSAMGDRLTLQTLVDSTREHGSISSTDWSTVANLGPTISRDIGRLRSYVLDEVAGIARTPFTGQRRDEIQDLTDGLIKESLALIVVAEQNYLLWQELRVANVVTHERKRLEQTNRNLRDQLAAMTKADQEMLDALHSAADGLLDPTGFEGFAPFARRQLKKRGDALDETVSWFAQERHLAASPLSVELPTLRESLGFAGHEIASGIDAAGAKIKSIVRGLGAGEPDESSSTSEG